MKRRSWNEQAENWIGWTRELDDDAYQDYAPVFFERFVPHGARRALDVGCGEGRSARDLAERATSTFAVDGSYTLVRAARDRRGGVRYVHADAARLPFRDRSFDLVTAYNSLMDLDDLAVSLAEISRVLDLGGRLAACVLHPIAEAGTFEERRPDARFVIDGSYFEEGPYSATFARRGHEITFSSSRYTLETYVTSLRRAGFVLEGIREAKPLPDALTRDASEERWTRVPAFLFLLALKHDPEPHDPEPRESAPRR